MTLDPNMTVLVVDDQAVMVRIIQGLLQQLGIVNLDAAQSAPAALEKMRAKRYDLVISDWHMERMSGYDLLHEIRTDPRLMQTPFIIVTGDAKTENVIAARKAGVSNYIVKPFNGKTLKSKIEAIFVTRSAAVPERPGIICPAIPTYV
jgi:two-component system, chemotaxis family, chemotaxis protein CheY